MIEALVAANFELRGVPHQSDAFSTFVAPRSSRGKTAYVLVDALRYEMGRELVAGLGEGYEVELVPVVAQLPTITEVGMSAVLPGTEKGMELVKAGRKGRHPDRPGHPEGPGCPRCPRRLAGIGEDRCLETQRLDEALEKTAIRDRSGRFFARHLPRDRPTGRRERGRGGIAALHERSARQIAAGYPRWGDWASNTLF